MIKSELGYGIPQAGPEVIKVLAIVFAPEPEQENIIAQLYQVRIELDRTPGYVAYTDAHVSSPVIQVLDRPGQW